VINKNHSFHILKRQQTLEHALKSNNTNISIRVLARLFGDCMRYYLLWNNTQTTTGLDTLYYNTSTTILQIPIYVHALINTTISTEHYSNMIQKNKNVSRLTRPFLELCPNCSSSNHKYVNNHSQNPLNNSQILKTFSKVIELG